MSKGQNQQQDQKNIDAVLSSEANALTKMQNAIGELLEANQQLKNSVELKEQVDALKKEAPSLPWFKRLVQIIPQVKYLFIKNDEQIAAERREINKEILTYVDNTLTKVGKKSSSLQVIIDKELQIGLDKILNNKSLLPEQLEKVEKLQEDLNNLNISQKEFREIVPKFYNAKEAVALVHEKTQLTQIQQGITELVDANNKVQGLLAIKKELAELRQELPSTWLDNLKKVVVKIKEAFVKNPEQILKDSVVKNETTLRYVDNALKTTGKIIESSKLARKNKLHKELENLKKRKLLPEQSERVTSLSNEIESTFAKTIAISEPLFTRDQEQTQSQPLYASMPNLQATSLPPAPPPPHLANTPLPNLAVRQPDIAATIPQAPPLPEQTAQQAAIGSMPPRPTRPAPPPPLTRTTSSPDINALKSEENVRQASTPSQVKRRAPLPPTEGMSLQNPAAQQPSVVSAVIPPAPPPPPPPHAVPGLQQGAHQVDTQVVPPLAVELNIPTPPPLPPAGGLPPPLPPAPPPPAGQPNNPAANPIEGQGNDHGQLLNEIHKGIQLKPVAVPEEKQPAVAVVVPEEKPVDERGTLLAAIRTGVKLKKIPETTKEEREKGGGTDKVEPEVKESSIGKVLMTAIAKRAKAFQGGEEDEHEHADLVKFIENEKVNESTLISKLHTDFLGAQDIKDKDQLVTFVMKEFDFDDDDAGDKQQAIIEKLEIIKEKYEKGSLDLSAKPVVDAAKGEISTDLVAKAQAITANITKTENVAGQSSKPPAPPIPPKARPPGSFAK